MITKDFKLRSPFNDLSEPSSEGNGEFRIPHRLTQCSTDTETLEDWEITAPIQQIDSPTLLPRFTQNPLFLVNLDDFNKSKVVSSPSVNQPQVQILALYHSKKCYQDSEQHSHDIIIETSKSRKNFPERCSTILKNWLTEHKENPYPTENDINHLGMATGLTRKQIRIFLVNNRSRFLNRSPKNGQSSQKLGKRKQNQNLASEAENLINLLEP